MIYVSSTSTSFLLPRCFQVGGGLLLALLPQEKYTAVKRFVVKVSIAPSLNRDYVGKGIFILKVNLLAKHEQLQFFFFKPSYKAAQVLGHIECQS